ncbi:hypothetical protein BD780_001746 [Clostridium tetanomorphum]|uniref:Uncharacterized protein n=1 Tax=Clostridium tetanomorphum TaxID=1553 RepID=A0A923EDF9_CLOTT|nr:hypothetical protein [Clostridium tetanomorphum]KAJ51888.1 hypothetical protein CTM_10386 [Clostridium tetanomorphum DSM 665]MBC2398615.1 hypothetical protein [Clostridium tetanomorphum]MBP1864108.1 hypothetical protein [Clostridium tetanomorphum]NRS84521.1 hypothetical protein [Clostridium tetanomorphum]NRZ97735.1 hypothetical protein [Clostridium tetanomorphum]
MKTFQDLISETLEVTDLEELESAADLFQFGIEKGYYTKKQVDEFNDTYWNVKNRLLTYSIAEKINWNVLDISSIVSKAPSDIRNDEGKLMNYVNDRIKALKGKIKGFK